MGLILRYANGYLWTDQNISDEQVARLRAAWARLRPDVLGEGPTADAWRAWASL